MKKLILILLLAPSISWGACWPWQRCTATPTGTIPPTFTPTFTRTFTPVRTYYPRKTMTPTPTVVPCVTAGTGEHDLSSGAGTSGWGGAPITLTSAGVVTAVNVWGELIGQQYSAAIYKGTDSLPGTLIGQTALVTIGTLGFNSAPLTASINMTDLAANYWVFTMSSGGLFYTATSTNYASFGALELCGAYPDPCNFPATVMSGVGVGFSFANYFDICAYTPTSTPTPTATFTRTATSTFTPVKTYVFTSTKTPSVTPTRTFTRTFTNTRTASYTYTFTSTITRTRTFTPTFTWSFTPSFTPTFTTTFTPSFTPTATPSFTPTFTPTETPTFTPTP